LLGVFSSSGRRKAEAEEFEDAERGGRKAAEA
jgi:hypothetical protein